MAAVMREDSLAELPVIPVSLQAVQSIHVSLAARLDLNSLMARVQSNCAESFEHLYKLTSPRLLGVILRINRNRAIAEEILQEVFVMAWERAAQFDGQRGNALTWLTAIAHNKAVSSLRAQACRPEFEANRQTDLEEDAYASIASDSPEPPEFVAQLRAARAVEAALASLPANCRHALALAFLDGLSHSEVAARLDSPLGSVKTWIRRSLVAIRPLLSEH